MILLSITDANYLGTNYVIIRLMLELTSWRLGNVTTTTTPRQPSVKRVVGHTPVPNNRNDTLRVRNSKERNKLQTTFFRSLSHKFVTVSQFLTEQKKTHKSEVIHNSVYKITISLNLCDDSRMVQSLSRFLLWTKYD
jgi:hypothetical protein